MSYYNQQPPVGAPPPQGARPVDSRLHPCTSILFPFAVFLSFFVLMNLGL